MKDLVIKVGEYEKGGETKGRYVKLGVILDGDNGEYALIEPSVDLAGCLIQQQAMNAGNGKPVKASLMCSVFSKDQSGQQQASESTGGEDLPF